MSEGVTRKIGTRCRRGNARRQPPRYPSLGDRYQVLPDIRKEVGECGRVAPARSRRWTLAGVLGAIISGTILVLGMLWLGRLLGFIA